MNREFVDKSSFLFGRDADVAYLMARTQLRGVTAVVARAQMGKSWLLNEVARKLAVEGWAGHAAAGAALSLRGLPPLVGMVESQGESADMLPRAVQDLYTRWLADAKYFDQALVAIEQQKKDFVGRVGEAVGSLVAKAAGLHGKGMEVVGSLVKQTFDGLASANRTLVDGIALPRLQITDSHDLLEIVWKVTKQPAVLILDQWEKSPDLVKEAKILDSYVRHHHEWEACHILLGTRPDDAPLDLVTKLEDEFPGIFEKYELGPMDLSGPAATATLLASLRERVPATRGVADDDLLGMIAGYPRVLSQWTSSFRAQSMRSREDLAEVAENANNFLYPEFEKLIPDMSDGERLLAIRLALLPTTSTAEDWRALKSVVLDGCPAKTLDSLMRADVLEGASPPTYGHAKRAEAAFMSLMKDCPNEMHETGEALVISLACEVSDLTPSVGVYISCLTQLRENAARLKLSPSPLALCESAYSVLLKPGLDPKKLRGAAAYAGDTGAFPLLVMGLNNAMAYAKQEQALRMRDDLLGELRKLAAAHMENSTVRKHLAGGLYNTLIDAKEEKDVDRRDRLLEELRMLAANYPEDGALREQLAKGLFNIFTQAQEDKDTLVRDKVIQEMRDMAATHPRERALTAELAMVLSNMLVYAKEGGAFELRDSLLDELRKLTVAHPEDEILREQFVMSLYNALNHAQQEGKPHTRDILLRELWTLALASIENQSIRGYLAKALSNRLAYAQKDETLEIRTIFLDQLRNLRAAYPEDSVVRGSLARSLNNMLLYSKETERPELRDSLVDELRKLSSDYPDDKAMSQMLAVGLVNILPLQEDIHQEFRDGLLRELTDLVLAHPDDPYIQTVIVPRLLN